MSAELDQRRVEHADEAIAPVNIGYHRRRRHWIVRAAATAADRPRLHSSGPYGINNPPPAPCWRPYNSESPFNDELPWSDPALTGIREHRNSAAIIAKIKSTANPNHPQQPANLVVRTDGHTGEPTYWASAADPTYTLRCTMLVWGSCPLEGKKIPIPDGAVVEGGTAANETNNDPGYMSEPDAHLTVIDQSTGWEYDLWQVHRNPIAPQGGLELRFSFGGQTRIDGDGTSSSTKGGGTAAHFGSLAGRIRAEELEVGEIDHALAIVVPCDNGDFIWPARGRGKACLTTADAPPMGARLHLKMTPSEIDQLKQRGVPAWKLAILRALAKYGGYINDTGSDFWFTFEQEAGSQYQAFGKQDDWVRMAQANNWDYRPPGTPQLGEHYAGLFQNNMHGVNWDTEVWNKLHVIYPSYPNTITIRDPDPSDPLVVMDAHGGNPPLATVVDGGQSPSTVKAAKNTVVTLITKATDGESGIKDVQIWMELTIWQGQASNNPIQNLEASNPDTVTRANGDSAGSSRIVSFNVDFPNILQGNTDAQAVVWARAINHLDKSIDTPKLTITTK